MMSIPISRWWIWINENYEYTIPVFILPIALVLLNWNNFVIKKSRNGKVPLPPGPRGLPIVGNLPFLDPNLHTCFAKLATTYGPIMKVQLGSRICIVLSSPLVAKEVLKDHDIIFANRDVPAVGFAGSYGGVDMLWSPYGDHWRMLRKICVRELLSNVRLEVLYGLRRREVRDMVNQINSNIVGCRPIDIGEKVLDTMFHLITSMLWGGTLEKEDRRRVSLEFQQVIKELVKLLGEPNVSDLFPALAIFDIQGMVRKMKKALLWFDRTFDSVIDQRLKMERGGKLNFDIGKKDFLQVLLEFKDQEEHTTPFTITHIKALFLDVMVAGTKSSSTTIEWVMAELMKQPHIMKKIQEELEEVVGVNNIVEESHLPQLSYLSAVVKEALRLHPVVPLLVPRSPSESCVVGGYMIPKGSKVMVNAWAIQRDPEVWDNPLEFRPERFLTSGSDGDYKGTNFGYIPFGSGRRICVGIPMAERMIPYLLASLLHSFNWKLPEETELDLSETFGLDLRKTIPLMVIPTPRLLEPELYN